MTGAQGRGLGSGKPLGPLNKSTWNPGPIGASALVRFSLLTPQLSLLWNPLVAPGAILHLKK